MLILLWIAGCVAAQSPLERAVTLAREKRYRESKQMLEGVPEPTDTRQRVAFHRLKAANASGLGDTAGAITEMLLALAQAPADPILLAGTAMVEFQAGRLDDALAHAQRAGENAPAKAVIGDIDEARGNFADAVKAYRAAVELAPGQEEYRVSLGYDLIQHQKFHAAAGFLEESVLLFPRSARLRTLAGIAEYSDGEPAKATANLLDAIVVDSKTESAYRCLARIALQSSAPQSQAVIDRMCSWNATVCAGVRLRAARESGDTNMQNAAIATLQRAAPSEPMARCELARAWEWTGRFEEARIEMEACLNFDPSPQNHYRLGLIYKRLGLDNLSRAEMERRQQILDKMSEETAAGLSALEAFRK
ncbi:MAG: hypothetical protein JO022_15440 [Acidobacteriaceae bacterium]|nr:hypothetical protein [Acidobacteriaceae bacterium]